ncbi:calcium-binding protein [Tardiphaga sp.]|uniref:calcium-binding protein n=1 Tax=Tardiphaga sp. TaxID=1926292 RepID=UPI00261E53B0|nr:calcium-binding protein [Tardiphaga sp.]
MATLHYASGNNIDTNGNFTPAQAGFNLADVSSVDQLNALPAGVKGLVWLDQGDGVTQSFIDAVKPYIGNPNAFGFFLKDEPDPTGQWNTLVTAANLKAESDYIHANVPGAKTFITMMNMGSSDNPSFANTYTPENTHIDFFGIDPYPVRSGTSTVDYSMIDKAVAAAEAAGIPQSNIVPVLQTFGGGNWVDDSGGHYVMPTAGQEQQMLDHWAALVPNAAFDYAYAWGAQNGDLSLEGSKELQDVFLKHNTGGTTPPVDASTGGGTTTGPTSPDGSTPPVDGSASGSTGNGSTSPSDPTTAPTTDATGSGHHHHGHSTGSGSTSSSGSTPSVDGSASGSTGNGSTSPSDPTTTPTTDATGSGHHHHGHSAGNGSTSSSGSTPLVDSTIGSTTPTDNSSGGTTTGSTSSSGGTSGGIATGSTSPSDPTTPPTTDATGSGHHHGHGLDFSQLVNGGTPSWSGNHHASTTTAAVGTVTDTTSNSVADSAQLPPPDLSDHHGVQHTDHHAWHW